MVRMTAAAQDGGVVALHIESPEASNEGTDLSPLPDIARTLERASLALSPQEPTTVSSSKLPLVQNGGAASEVRSAPGTNSVASEVAGLGAAVVNSAAGNFFRTVAVNSVPGNLGGQGVRTLTLNSVSNNNVRTLAANSVAGNVIRPLSLNSVAGNAVCSRSENVPVNSVSGTLLNQGVGTVLVNSVAGSVLSPATLALNSVGGNVVRTLSVNPGQDLGSLSLNSVTGNVIRTVAVNSLPGQGNVTLNSGSGNRQQIFVVASPGGGAPNIKFCILHTVPNGPPTPPVKRPASESPAPVIKKPCTPPLKREAVDPPTEAKPTATQLEFLCEWKNCRMRFSRAGEVLVHVAHAHCTQEEGPCAWEGCTAGGRRRRLSLLTHLQDWHCSERLVRLASNRRRVATLPPPPQPPPHPGYAPDAALAAIRRRHPKEPLRVPAEEGALAKSVHLTAALVLRNLLTHSAWARRCARRFEPELACAAMSGGEASRALAQCLARLDPC